MIGKKILSSFPFRRKQQAPVSVQRKSTGSIIVSGDSLLGSSLLYGGGLFGNYYLTHYIAMSLYRNSDAVATAVNIIADELENIKPVLRMQDGKLDDSHEVLELLENPNPFETWNEFMGKLSRHYLITHDAYIMAVGNVKFAPSSIHATKPQCVTVNEGNDNYPATYNITDGYGTGHFERNIVKNYARFYCGNLKEMYHCMGFSSRTDDTRADSPLLAAFKAVSQQVQGMIHNVKLLENGARPSLLVNFKDDISVDEARERKDFMKEQIGGAENAGEIFTTFAKDMDVKEFSMSNKDMDYENLERIARTAIYNTYKIPLPLISNDASTFSNMSSSVEHLYDFSVLPLFNRLGAGLGHMLLPRFGLDPRKVSITFNPDSIDALRTRTLKEIEQRKKIGIETTNELRSGLANREPIEGGDVLYQPANLVPAGQDLFTDDNVLTPEEQAAALAARDAK